MRIVKCRFGAYTSMASDPRFVYVGREFGGFPESPLGNPFKSGRDGTLAQVLQKYREWLWDHIQSEPRSESVVEALAHISVVDALASIPIDAVLGCWCCDSENAVACKTCHAGVIARARMSKRVQEILGIED